MDRPTSNPGDQLKARAIQWIPRLKSFELIAEQLMNYLFPQAGLKKHMLVLMCFEMAIAYFRLKSLFSGTETLLMEEKLHAYFLADAKRRELIQQRTMNIWGLLKLHQSKEEQANPTAEVPQANQAGSEGPQPTDSSTQAAVVAPSDHKSAGLLSQIHHVLGLKLKPKKPEPVATDTKEGEDVPEGQNTGVAENGSSAQATEQPPAETQLALVPTTSNRAAPAVELVADNEWVPRIQKPTQLGFEWQFESYKFNEDQLVKLSRKKQHVALLQSLPVPSRLARSSAMPSWVKASEVLHILRPLFHCLLISLNQPGSYRPIIISAIIDMVNLIIKQLYKPRSIPEIEEIKYRKRNLLFPIQTFLGVSNLVTFRLLYFYMLRKPVYTSFFRPKILEPLLKRLVRYDVISNFLLQSLDYASSYSLVL